MKIGILLPNLLTTSRFKNRIYAARDLAVNLADELVALGHSVKVYSSSSLATKAQVVEGIKELEDNNRHSVKDLWKSEAVRKELSTLRDSFEYNIDLISKAIIDAKNKEIEILHSFDDYISHYFTELSPIPIVYTLHDPVFEQDTFEYWRLKHFANHNYIAISQSQRERYEKEMGLHIVKTIYHGVRSDSVTFSQTGGKNILFIGRLLPQKGVEEAMEVAIKVRRSLSIATSSNYRETDYYKQQIQPHLNSSHIQEIGYVTGELKDITLQQSKLLIMPIKWDEPFGLSMVESMLAGTPVVAYSRGAVPEIVVDGKTGFLVNPSDGVDGLIKAVEKMYALSEEEYMAMRKNCRDRVLQNFSLDKMVKNHVDLYAQLSSSSH